MYYLKPFKAKFVAIILLSTLIFSLVPVSPNLFGAETVYTFTGGGKSHGVGMSMAGVKKLGAAGRDYPTILKYYYKGISVGRMAGLPKIVRAAVYGTSTKLSFSANNHVRVVDINGNYLKTVLKGEIVSVKHGSGRYRVTVQRNGKTIYNHLHPRAILIQHWKASAIMLRNNGRRYEGDFFARSIGGSAIWAINRVPLENYLRGLGEEPESWPIKGLRTLAVAARTYAAEKILKRKTYYDLNQTQQFYVGIRRAPRMAFAVNSTKSIVAMYGGKPIIAAYSANNGGFEADFTTIWGGAGYGYLKARVDNWSKGTTDYRWGPHKFSRTRLESIFKKNGVNVGTLQDIKFSGRGVDRRPQKATIVGTAGSKTVWAYGQFSRWLGFKSSLLWVSKGSSASVNVGRARRARHNAAYSGAFGKRALQQVIVLDPGHGGRQSGAVGPNGLQEKNVNLKVALKLRNYLKAAGAKVVMTRTTDKTLSLGARTALAKKVGATRFISVHHNSARSRRVNGTETYMRRGADSLSSDMARKVYKSLTTSLGVGKRGIKRAGFYVLRNTKMPAILTEASFISNPREASRLRTAAYIDKEARAIFNGLRSHMSLRRSYTPLGIAGTTAAAADIYFPHVIDTNGYWRTYVSVKNTASESRNVTLSYYKDNGSLVTTNTVSLAADQTHNFYPKSVVGADFIGSIKASTTDASLVGQLSQISKTNKALANNQALTPATELYFPRVVDNTQWRSMVSIKNSTDAVSTVTINYYAIGGSLIKSEVANIAAQAKYSFYPLTNVGAAFDGSIEIQSTGSATGYVNRINAKKNRFAIAPAVAKSANLYFAQAPDNSIWKSYLAVKNSSDTAQSITITGYNSDGVTSKQTTLTINPKSVYENRVANLLGSNFTGSVSVSAASEVLSAYLIQTDLKSASLGIMEGQQPQSVVHYVSVNDGNTWNSDVAIRNTDAALANLALAFFQAAGTSTYTNTTSINGNGFYRFNPGQLAETNFNGSVKATTTGNQLVGYLSMYR